MKTMNVSFDEVSIMAFKQYGSKPELQSMTSGQINSGLDLTYAPSTITTQQPTEGELDLLFETMYDDYIGGQPSSALRIVPTAQAHQVRQTLTMSTSIADTASTPTNLSSQATIFPNTSQYVDGLNSQQQHAQQQEYQAPIQPKTVADNVPNAMIDANTFDVDGLNSQQQHAQQQEYQALIQPETVADNVPNAIFDANSFVNPFATPSTSAAESSS
nr:hypothetical protein [Tanacetum cinerariifolium]